MTKFGKTLPIERSRHSSIIAVFLLTSGVFFTSLTQLFGVMRILQQILFTGRSSQPRFITEGCLNLQFKPKRSKNERGTIPYIVEFLVKWVRCISLTSLFSCDLRTKPNDNWFRQCLQAL